MKNIRKLSRKNIILLIGVLAVALIAFTAFQFQPKEYDVSVLHETVSTIQERYSANGVMNETLASALVEVNKLNTELETKDFVNLSSIKEEIQKADEIVSKIDLGDPAVTVDDPDKAKVSLVDLQNAVTKAVEKLGLQKYEVEVENIIVDKTLLCGKIGDTHEIKYQVFPTFLEDVELVWASSDDEVVTVTDGTLTFVSAGVAKVTVTEVKSGVSCLIDVMSLYSEDESAFGIAIDGGNRYLVMKAMDTGYSYAYSFYDANLKNPVSSVFNKPDKSLAEACMEVLTDNDLVTKDIEVLEYNAFMSKVAVANAPAPAPVPSKPAPSKPSAPVAGTSSVNSSKPAPASSDSSSAGASPKPSSSGTSKPSAPASSGKSEQPKIGKVYGIGEKTPPTHISPRDLNTPDKEYVMDENGKIIDIIYK